MLADVVEGATRAMSEPTPSRIETVVNEMAMKRLLDGQFDQCDLTMKELKQIEVSLIKSLCGMYHGRIKYPKMETLAGRTGKVVPAKETAPEHPHEKSEHDPI
jgi:membrane-associated HD superfamily phosphohydrolase